MRRRASVLGLVLLVASARAAIVHDPFVEALRAGAFRDPGDVVVSDGWPQELLTPLQLERPWIAAMAVCVDGDTLGGVAAPVATSLVRATLTPGASLAAWRDEVRRGRDALLAADAGDSLALAPPEPTMIFAAPLAMLLASRAWEAGADADAARWARYLVDGRDALGLSAEEAFVWDLRARCLAERAGTPDDPARVWPLLTDLGLYDVRSGWALWTACRRARSLPLIPPGAADRSLGLALASGGEAWLDAAALHAAGFPAEVEAGLGAIVLPSGDLAAHFARFATPPRDGLLQGYWLQGQRRREPGDGAWYEHLAALSGLKDGHRLDTWRRASEARLLAGSWTAGLDDLEAGLRLMDSDASWSMRRKLRSWTAQALVLAVARDQRRDAKRIRALAAQYLTGAQGAAFGEEAAPWLGDADATATGSDPNGRLAAARQKVIAGRATDLTGADLELPDPVAWRDGLWSVWAALGRQLVGVDDPRFATYRAGLDSVATPGLRPNVREARACEVAGRYLASTTAAEAVRRWTLASDVGRTAGIDALPVVSPLAALIAASAGADRAAVLRRHALLGAAIATGDARGQIAAAVTLSLVGLTDDQQLLLEYPVPAAPSVREALADGPASAAVLLAIARNESLFEPADRSRAGALGYMQIMPFHYGPQARAAGPAHWSHAAVSLRLGADLITADAARYHGDPYRAVAAYNAGPSAVDRWDRQLGARADRAMFAAWIGYDETRRYVTSVLTDREIYRWLLAR